MRRELAPASSGWSAGRTASCHLLSLLLVPARRVLLACTARQPVAASGLSSTQQGCRCSASDEEGAAQRGAAQRGSMPWWPSDHRRQPCACCPAIWGPLSRSAPCAGLQTPGAQAAPPRCRPTEDVHMPASSLLRPSLRRPTACCCCRRCCRHHWACQPLRAAGVPCVAPACDHIACVRMLLMTTCCGHPQGRRACHVCRRRAPVPPA